MDTTQEPNVANTGKHHIIARVVRRSISSVPHDGTFVLVCVYTFKDNAFPLFFGHIVTPF